MKAILKGKNKKLHVPAIVPIIVSYIILCVIIAVLSPNFLTVRNILNIGQFSSMMGVAAVGVTFVIVSGGIDISVGAIMGLTCMTIAKIIPKSGFVIPFILIGIGVGLACGAVNGIAITFGKVTPLIATLATMSIFRGFAFIWNNGVSMPISNKEFGILGRGSVGEIPVSLIVMILIVVIFSLVMKYTTFGRKVYSIGGNTRASYLSGINVKATRFLVYLISGGLAGLAGAMLTSQIGAGVANGGTGYEMDVIAAVILGGTSLTGGKGNIVGSFIGVLILVTLNNGMNLLGVQAFWQMVAKGLVLMLAVVLDVKRTGGYE